MKVKIYATLRALVDAEVLELETRPGDRIIDLLHEIVRRWPQLKPELLDDNGALVAQIHLFLNGRDVRYLEGLETIIPAEADIRIFPPVGGGA
ncbi:MAG: MoaD/ThiS family protein [Chloroflexi bacterium]|nr:MoaD/ThiS family protein [Chloroflexota bacterium]